MNQQDFLWKFYKLQSILLREDLGSLNHSTEGAKKEKHRSLSLTLLSFVCFEFVNDTDIPVIAPLRDMSGENVALIFQKAIDSWAGILKATGGKLEPAK